MTYLLVPQEVSAVSARLWAGAIDEGDLDAASLRVAATDGTADVPLGPAWESEIDVAGHAYRFGRVDVDGLAPRREYRFELRRGDAVVSDATVTTLPDTLPGLDDRPFTILLGSCYARRNDGGGLVGRSYVQLPAAARPDVKILCGDQVYLDVDSIGTWNPFIGEDDLRRYHLANYLATWSQAGGFRELLRSGATWFASDDHDFWNNAPNASVTAPSTLVPGGADRWWREASSLYAAFQRRTVPLVTTFDVGELSLCVTDTRFHRERGSGRFVTAEDMAAIAAWANGLRGPGCLVTGQPVLEPPRGAVARLSDMGLPDYDQYADLVRAITQAPHAIVVLTGDVHFGRVAVSQLAEGRELVEVISSPLTLINSLAGGHWQPAPDLFPVEPQPWLARSPVETAPGYAVAANHWATVEFAAAGAFTRLRVRAWPIPPAGRPPVPTSLFERWIS